MWHLASIADGVFRQSPKHARATASRDDVPRAEEGLLLSPPSQPPSAAVADDADGGAPTPRAAAPPDDDPGASTCLRPLQRRKHRRTTSGEEPRWPTRAAAVVASTASAAMTFPAAVRAASGRTCAAEVRTLPRLGAVVEVRVPTGAPRSVAAMFGLARPPEDVLRVEWWQVAAVTMETRTGCPAVVVRMRGAGSGSGGGSGSGSGSGDAAPARRCAGGESGSDARGGAAVACVGDPSPRSCGSRRHTHARRRRAWRRRRQAPHAPPSDGDASPPCVDLFSSSSSSSSAQFAAPAAVPSTLAAPTPPAATRGEDGVGLGAVAAPAPSRDSVPPDAPASPAALAMPRHGSGGGEGEQGGERGDAAAAAPPRTPAAEGACVATPPGAAAPAKLATTERLELLFASREAQVMAYVAVRAALQMPTAGTTAGVAEWAAADMPARASPRDTNARGAQ